MFATLGLRLWQTTHTAGAEVSKRARWQSRDCLPDFSGFLHQALFAAIRSAFYRFIIVSNIHREGESFAKWGSGTGLWTARGAAP